MTLFQLPSNVMKYFRCQLKICKGVKFTNVLSVDKQANKFEEQDFILFNLTFGSLAQIDNV